MKLLSIVVPVFNDEQYLGECLSSIVPSLNAQSEVIVVDDGSTDGTSAIGREFEERVPNRVRMLRHKECRGVAIARNTGLAHAVGSHVLFVDSDDRLTTDAINLLLNSIAIHMAEDVFVGKWASESLTSDNAEMFVCPHVEKISSECFLLRLNESGYLPDVCWHYVVRRDFLLNNGIRFIDANVGEDQAFVAEILVAANELVLIPEHIYWHREKAGGQKSLRDPETTIGFAKLIEHLSSLRSRYPLAKGKTEFLQRRLSNARAALGARVALHNQAELLKVISYKGNEEFENISECSTVVDVDREPFSVMIQVAHKAFVNKIKTTVIPSHVKAIYVFCYSVYTLAAIRVLESQGCRIEAVVDNNANAKKADAIRIITPAAMIEEVTDWEVEAKFVLVCNPRLVTITKIKCQLVEEQVPERCIGHVVV